MDVAGGAAPEPFGHAHVFLGSDHEQAERRTWAVIALCAAMMVLEIVGGLLFGSIALVADGMHMSTHAGALLLTAIAYRYACRYARDARFTFGTGKLGDLAGFTSAIMLAMIALLIGYEAIGRLFAPVPISFAEAIPIAVLGVAVNVVSAWLLSGGHPHGRGHHGHGHHGHGHHGHGLHHEANHRVETPDAVLSLGVYEQGVPPVFRVRAQTGRSPPATAVTIETTRPGGARHLFAMADRGEWLESIESIPEPHAFTATVRVGNHAQTLVFEEHDHDGAAHRDNNMRAAVVHVLADTAVSVLVIVGLLLGRAFGWLWMDPLVGMVGALVIASWSVGLIRDTAAILLDMVPDRRLEHRIRQLIEADGDKVADLHLWRLGPGHLSAIVSVITAQQRGSEFYHDRLACFPSVSHLTIEVRSAAG